MSSDKLPAAGHRYFLRSRATQKPPSVSSAHTGDEEAFPDDSGATAVDGAPRQYGGAEQAVAAGSRRTSAAAGPVAGSSLGRGGASASRQTVGSATGSAAGFSSNRGFSREQSDATVVDVSRVGSSRGAAPVKTASHQAALGAIPAAAASTARLAEGSRLAVTAAAGSPRPSVSADSRKEATAGSASASRSRSAGTVVEVAAKASTDAPLTAASAAAKASTDAPLTAASVAPSAAVVGDPASHSSVEVSTPAAPALPSKSLTKVVAAASGTAVASASPAAASSASKATTLTWTGASPSPAGDASPGLGVTTPSSRGKAGRSVEIKTTPTVYETKMGMGDFAAARPGSSTPKPWRLELAQGVLSGKQGGGMEVAVKGPDHVSHVRVQDGKVVVEEQPEAPAAPVGPRRPGPSIVARRGQKSPFTMRLRMALGDAGPPEPPIPAQLIEHVNKVLPVGLRTMLASLQNHCDLGVMATCAATLDRHKRLGAALEALQAMQAGKQQAVEPGTPTPTPRSRWLGLGARRGGGGQRGRWQRGLFPLFGLLPRKRRAVPHLPPTHRPNPSTVERCLLDALADGLRLDAGPAAAVSDSQTCLAPQLQYSGQWAGDACRILAAHITRSVNGLGLKRYKSACVVRIIEKCHQGLCSHFAAIWDENCDCFCCVPYETDSFIAYATLVLVYWD